MTPAVIKVITLLSVYLILKSTVWPRTTPPKLNTPLQFIVPWFSKHKARAKRTNSVAADIQKQMVNDGRCDVLFLLFKPLVSRGDSFW